MRSTLKKEVEEMSEEETVGRWLGCGWCGEHTYHLVAWTLGVCQVCGTARAYGGVDVWIEMTQHRGDFGGIMLWGSEGKPVGRAKRQPVMVRVGMDVLLTAKVVQEFLEQGGEGDEVHYS